MECTQQEFLDALKESGREGWTLRLMTSLREEGFLPPLKRRTQPGTNKPHYVWEEDDFDQIVEVYDWWDYYEGNREPLARVLWLQGYAVPLDQLRDPYLPVIEMLQQQLTHGQTELDDILDAVSKAVVRWSRKFRFSPKLASERKKVGVEQMERIIEPIFVALAVPEQVEPTFELIQPFLSDTEETSEGSTDPDEDFLTKTQMIASILRDILTLHNLREVLETATHEQWEQAREDYLVLCELLGKFVRQTTRPEHLESLEELAVNLRLTGAVWLIVPLLSTRCRGHGHWIDEGFDKIQEFLDSPSFLELVERQQQKWENHTIEADAEELALE